MSPSGVRMCQAMSRSTIHSCLPLRRNLDHSGSEARLLLRPGSTRDICSPGYNLNVGKGKIFRPLAEQEDYTLNPWFKVSPNRLSVRHTPVIHSFPYWICFILPVVILAAALIIYKTLCLHACRFLCRAHAGLSRRQTCSDVVSNARGFEESDVERFLYRTAQGSVGAISATKLRDAQSELMRDNIRQVLKRHVRIRCRGS